MAVVEQFRMRFSDGTTCDVYLVLLLIVSEARNFSLIAEMSPEIYSNDKAQLAKMVKARCLPSSGVKYGKALHCVEVTASVSSADPKTLPFTQHMKMIACKTMVSTGCNTMLSCVNAKDMFVETERGMSGVEAGAAVTAITGFKPKEAGLRSLNDLSFMITYADRAPEFVDYSVCIQKIPKEVTQFLFRNDVFTLD